MLPKKSFNSFPTLSKKAHGRPPTRSMRRYRRLQALGKGNLPQICKRRFGRQSSERRGLRPIHRPLSEAVPDSHHGDAPGDRLRMEISPQRRTAPSHIWDVTDSIHFLVHSCTSSFSFLRPSLLNRSPLSQIVRCPRSKLPRNRRALLQDLRGWSHYTKTTQPSRLRGEDTPKKKERW